MNHPIIDAAAGRLEVIVKEREAAAHRRGWDEAQAAIADAAHQIRDGGLVERFIRALPYPEPK